MRILIQDAQSEFYKGPKTDAKFAMYVDCKDKQLLVEFDSEENLADALVKAGVNLFKMLHPEYQGPCMVPKHETH
jgi:hypothetical protein